jgi:hypothetical protein
MHSIKVAIYKAKSGKSTDRIDISERTFAYYTRALGGNF